jgi:pimeloyl-ACP methyl ester carboxylesterase
MTTIGEARPGASRQTGLHVEVSGAGSPVALVPGAGGDGSQYEALARKLAARYTVIAYDRRNNGRNPRRPDWAATSVEQQADDLLALLGHLGLQGSTVYGNSTGALIALATAMRRPSAFSAVVLHEPALLSVLKDPGSAVAMTQPVIAAGVENGGAAGGAEAFLRFAAGDAASALPAPFVDRLRSNADVLLEAEFGSFAAWRPDPGLVQALGSVLTILTAEQTAPFFAEAADWLADAAGVTRRTVPGGHMGFLDHPDAVAEAIDAAASRAGTAAE